MITMIIKNKKYNQFLELKQEKVLFIELKLPSEESQAVEKIN